MQEIDNLLRQNDYSIHTRKGNEEALWLSPNKRDVLKQSEALALIKSKQKEQEPQDD